MESLSTPIDARNERGLPHTGLMRAKQIHPFFGIGLSTWWRWVKDGRAPKGIRLGPRTTVWKVEDVQALLNELASDSHSEF